MQMCRLYDMGGYTSDNVRIMTGRENMREAVETRIMRANAKAWVIDGEDRRECREWVKDRYIWRDPMRQLMKAEAQSEDE